MNACTICRLPVLELDGQFENLEPYYAEPGHPAADLAGECHSYCISRHEFGRVWHDWRVQNYTTVRGYRVAGEQDGWTVLAHQRQRDVFALHATGITVGAEPPGTHGNETEIEGGVLIAIDEEFNLALDDAHIAADLKSHLQRDGRYPISALLSVLGAAERTQWPKALDSAFFLFDAELYPEWTDTELAVRGQYTKFLPIAVARFWKAL